MTTLASSEFSTVAKFATTAAPRRNVCLKSLFGVLSGEKPRASPGVFSPATPQVVIRAYISANSVIGDLRTCHCSVSATTIVIALASEDIPAGRSIFTPSFQ